MAEIRFHWKARIEYQEAIIWYANRSRDAALRFEAELDEVLRRISENPSMFPLYDEDERIVMLRRFPYGVVYLERPDELEVIAVAHLRRAPGYWQDRH